MNTAEPLFMPNPNLKHPRFLKYKPRKTGRTYGLLIQQVRKVIAEQQGTFTMQDIAKITGDPVITDNAFTVLRQNKEIVATAKERRALIYKVSPAGLRKPRWPHLLKGITP